MSFTNSTNELIELGCDFKYDSESEFLQKIHLIIYVINKYKDSSHTRVPRFPPSFPNTES